MANGGRIDWTIGFKYDKTGLNQVTADLNRIASMTTEDFMKINPKFNTEQAEKELKELKNSAEQLRTAFQRSLNVETGVVNIQKLNKEIKSIDVNRLKQAGAAGEVAFNNMYKAALTTHNEVKKVKTTLDKLGETFSNTIKWGIASSALNTFTGAAQQAYGYIKSLDTSLNDIRIVTGKSADEMERFSVVANNAAKALGKTTNDYTKAALIYYQQGLSDEETQARTDVTLKAASVTGQTASEVSEQLTAVWNGYKVSAEETEVYVDKLAKVAAATAADLEELSTGMSKVASAANVMGVDVDQLNAQLATIISVTREAPETIGTSLKTVYARMATIKAGGIDEEDGATLTSYTEKMNQLGINVLDSNNKLRDMGEVIEEIGGKWSSMSREQQVALAQTIAGTRQYSRMMALFDNWDQYQRSLSLSANAMGTLQEQQDIYMDSISAHLNTLTAQWEDLYDSILDEGAIKFVLDGFTGILDVVTKLTDAIGGGGGLIALLGMIGAKALAPNIGSTVAAKVDERNQANQYMKTMEQRAAAVKDDGSRVYTTEGEKAMIAATKKYADYIDVLPENVIQAAEESVALLGDSYNVKAILQEKQNALNEEQKELEEKENEIKENIRETLLEQQQIEEEIKNKEQELEKLAAEQVKLAQQRLDKEKLKELDNAKQNITNNSNELKNIQIGADRLTKKQLEDQGKFKELSSKLATGNLSSVEMNDFIGVATRAKGDIQVVTQADKPDFSGKEGVGKLSSYLNKTAGKTFGLSDEEIKKFKQRIKSQEETLKNGTETAKVEEELDKIYNEINNKLNERVRKYEELIQLAEKYKEIIEESDATAANKVKQAETERNELKNKQADADKHQKENRKEQEENRQAQEENNQAQKETQTNLDTINTQITELENESATAQAAVAGVYGEMAKGATEAVGGFGSVMMGVMSLRGAFQALKDDSLSSMEKFLQVSLSISMALPSITSGISNLANGVHTVRENLPLLIKNLQDFIIKKTALLTAQEADNAATTANTVANTANAVSQEAVNAAETRGVVIDEARTVSIGTLTKATGAYIAAQLKANAALIAFSGLAIAGVAAVVFLMNAEKKAAEASAESAKAQADEANKALEAKKELQEQTNSLNKTLKENQENYTNSQLVDYRRQVYDLCQQYGDEESAIKALTASYEGLQAIMNKVSEENNAELAESAERTKEANIAAAAAQYRADNSTKNFLKDLWHNVYTFDTDKEEAYYNEINSGFNLSGFNSKKDIRQKSAFSNLGIDISEHGYMDVSDLIRVASTNREELDALLQQYSNASWAGDIQTVLNTYSSQIEAATEAYKEEKENLASATAQIFYDQANSKLSKNKLATASDYGELLNSVTKELASKTDSEGNKLFKNDEEARKAARQYLSSFSDELAQYDQDLEIAESITWKYPDMTAEEIADQLHGLSDTEIRIVTTFVDPDNEDKSPLDTLEKTGKNLEHLQGYNVLIKLKAVEEEGINVKTGLKDKQLTDLFAGGEFEKASGYTQEEFARLAGTEQVEIIHSMYTKWSAYSRENAENIREDLRQQSQDLAAYAKEQQKYVDESQKDIDLNTNKITSIFSNNYIYKENENDLGQKFFKEGTSKEDLDKVREAIENNIELIEAYHNRENDPEAFERQKEIVETKLGDTTMYINYLDELISTYVETKDALDEVTEENQKYQNAVDSSETSIATITKDLENMEDTLNNTNWAGIASEEEAQLKEYTDQIKDLASAYNDLKTAVEQYNESGTLTFETLNDILNMDDAYVATLNLENGQLSINEEAYKEVTIAKLNLAKASAYDQAMAELEAIAHDQATDALFGTITAQEEAIAGVEKAEAALKKGSAAWNYYWASTNPKAFEKNKDAANNVIKALENRLLMIDQAINQVSTNGMDTFSQKNKKSSSSNTKDPKEEKYLKREKDIYKEINAEIKDIESTLNRIKKVESHSWGKSAQVALDKESKQLDKLLEKYKKKASMQEGDLSRQRGSLEKEGVKFSADGSAITNADEVLDKEYAKYNAMVDKYNAMNAEEQEKFKKELDTEKEYIDDLEKAIKNYESTFSDYQSTLDTILEKHYEQIELAVKQFNNKVKVELELDDAKKDWNDFWYDVIQDIDDDDFVGQFEKSFSRIKDIFGGLGGSANGVLDDILNHLNDTVAEVNKQIAGANVGGGDSLFGDDTALSKETLTEWRDTLIQYVKEAKQELENMMQAYLSLLDSAQEKIDEQIKGWEAIGSHLEHNIKLIKMISGEKAYDALNKQYEAQYKNILNNVETQRMSKDYWADQMKKYEELMKTADKSSKAYKTYSEAYKKASENYRNAVADLDKTVEEALEALEEWKKNQLNAIEDKLTQGLTGTKLDLEVIEEEWQLINEWADKYYDNIERSLAMEEYTDILNKAANATGLTAENQEKLNKFREQELKVLKEKENLTEYDIEESKARLAILQQEIALEDARQNKSKMRLRRDSQGNYSYQYTGDEESIEEAEGKLLTAKKEWYDLVKKRMKETTEYSMQLAKENVQLWNEYQEALAAKDYERADKLKALYDRNVAEIQKWGQEVDKNQRDMMNGIEEYFSYVQNGTILPQFDTTARKMAERFVTDSDSVKASCETAITEVQKLTEEFARKTQEVLEAAGVDYQNLVENGIDPTTDALEDMVQTNEELADQLDEINDKLDEQGKILEEVEDNYNKLKDAAATAIDEANKALNTLADTAVTTVEKIEAAIVKAQAAAEGIKKVASTNTDGSQNDTGTEGGNPSSPTPNTPSKEEKQQIYYKWLESLPNGIERYGLYDKDRHFIKAFTFNPSEYNEKLIMGEGPAATYLYHNGYPKNKYKISKFKSGGYTGTWTGADTLENGRLAFVHQKELILNANDTSNLLKTIDSLRSVVDKIDVNYFVQDLMKTLTIPYQLLDGLTSELSNITSYQNDNRLIEGGNVTINADFPNVVSADEIYDALINLETTGLQAAYANTGMMLKAY